MQDSARVWVHPTAPSVNLMRARFVTHAFGQHSHPTFSIGVVQRGTEQLRIGARTELVRSGGIALINPDVVHTGRPVDPHGWTYRVLYPPVELLADIAGTDAPWFGQQFVYDSDAVGALLAAHRASEAGDRLTSSTLLRTALGYLLMKYGEPRPPPPSPAAGSRQVEAARELLCERLVDAPSLDELAAAVGSGRFALVRAFRERYGLPPHAYLIEQRLRRACELLDQNVPPGMVAAQTGFADQSHLTRHFRRRLGVPPGQYRRKNVQD